MMNKKILLSALIASSIGVQAQSFQENFNGIGSGFSTWKQIKDNGTPEQDLFNDNAWIQKDLSSYNYNLFNKYAISTSWYQEQVQADRWIISPTIKVTNENNTLYWESYAIDPSYPDGYKVLLSTTGDNKEDFTTELFSIDEAPSSPIFNSVDLSAYANQNVHIAFVNNSTGKYWLAIDNIYLSKPNLGNRWDIRSLIKSPTSVNINWLGGDNAYVSLVEPGQLPSGDGKFYTGNEISFTNLPEGKLWHAYIKGDKEAMWVGPYPVGTAYTLPYKEDFEGDVLSRNVYPDTFTLEENNGKINNGGQQVMTSKTIANNSIVNTLYLAPIYVDDNQKLKLSFDMNATGNSNEAQIALWVYPEKGIGPSVLWVTNKFETGVTQHIEDEIETGLTKGIYYFAIIHSTNYDTTGKLDELYIDNIELADGSLSTSDISNQKEELRISPNPVKDTFTIEGNDSVKNIRVYALDGTLITSFPSMKTYDISSLKPGTYLINIETEKSSFSKKLIKK